MMKVRELKGNKRRSGKIKEQVLQKITSPSYRGSSCQETCKKKKDSFLRQLKVVDVEDGCRTENREFNGESLKCNGAAMDNVQRVSNSMWMKEGRQMEDRRLGKACRNCRDGKQIQSRRTSSDKD